MSQNFWKEETVKETLAAIYKRAAVDDAFRTLCLTDPGKAVKELTGQDLPEGFVLRFVDNEDADLTIVLPDPQSSEELSAEQLEAVAGGFGVYDGPSARKPFSSD